MSNRPNLNEQRERYQREIHDNRICAHVGKKIKHIYPGWKWYIESRIDTGLVSIRCLDLDGDFGIYLPIIKALEDIDGKLLMRAGGEILERYRMERKFRPVVLEVERDVRGCAILKDDSKPDVN